MIFNLESFIFCSEEVKKWISWIIINNSNISKSNKYYYLDAEIECSLQIVILLFWFALSIYTKSSAFLSTFSSNFPLSKLSSCYFYLWKNMGLYYCLLCFCFTGAKKISYCHLLVLIFDSLLAMNSLHYLFG